MGERTHKQTFKQQNAPPDTDTYKTRKQENTDTTNRTIKRTGTTKNTRVNKQATMSGWRDAQPGQAQGAPTWSDPRESRLVDAICT